MMGNKAKVFAFTTLVQHGTRSCNQWNKVKKKKRKKKKVIQRHTDLPEKVKLFLFTKDVTVYIENLKDCTILKHLLEIISKSRLQNTR